MKLRNSVLVAGVISVVGLAGCQSPRDSRISEKRELFASLPPSVQATIKEGLVDLGFSPEMVQMALGTPNQVQSGQAAEGQMMTWTYKNFVLSDSAAVKVGMNTPGTRYQPGPIVSPNAPGGPSLGSTKNVGPQATVSDMADMRVGTLFVEFLNNRVFSLRMDR